MVFDFDNHFQIGDPGRRKKRRERSWIVRIARHREGSAGEDLSRKEEGGITMSGVGSGYDLSVTTFSPEGRVFQVEYAGKATDNGVPCVGVCCKDGAILAVEKPEETKMMLPQSNRRIFTVSRHCGMAVPGKLPDGRQIVRFAPSTHSRSRPRSALNEEDALSDPPPPPTFPTLR